ncbi:hypothetical protein EVJ58_g9913 [Rhodofomes roseus]|uniref:LIM zinc-binding domain-containing protein n=1 Tax=Rhodofomes roseus TaxID=34475 RepID=A0A4Y9XT82_9APHY|nr:hypothetical protein EVJ58_g9913 [Rhodofomes roseus]
MNEDDQLVSVLPIHYSNALAPDVHIHQYPLLTRPLQVPPTAAASGKRIKARLKPDVRRLELHVPVDTRPEVWNAERSTDLGKARVEDDKEKNQALPQVKQREGEEPRLAEVRMRSEQVPHTGVYVLGQLHLHPISETHQLRPTLTYMDVLSRKNRRGRGGAGSDDDSDEGPPPDPDEPAPAPAPKKEKKAAGEAKEVQVAVRKADDRGPQAQGGMTQVRRDMLKIIHDEEDQEWQDLEYCDGEQSCASRRHAALTRIRADMDSDTEPESQVSVTVEGWDAGDFAHIATTQALCSSQTSSQDMTPSGSDVEQAIRDLRSLDLEEVQKDDSLHGVIQVASTTILTYLDNVVVSLPQDIGDIESAMSTLSMYLFPVASASLIGTMHCGSVDPENVALLFAYRQVFYVIAAREVHVGMASSAVVCWVDVVFAKLGEAITTVAAGSPPSTDQSADLHASMQKQFESHLLRAATQLPSTWSALPTVLSAAHASPAACRLAMRLLYGIYVLRPYLQEINTLNSASSADSKKLIAALRCYLDRTPGATRTASTTGLIDADGFGTQDRVTCAMFLSLFAVCLFITALTSAYSDTLRVAGKVTDPPQDSDITNRNQVPFRPNTDAALLRHVMDPIATVTKDVILEGLTLVRTDTIRTVMEKLFSYGSDLKARLEHNHSPSARAQLEVSGLMTDPLLRGLFDSFSSGNASPDTLTSLRSPLLLALSASSMFGHHGDITDQSWTDEAAWTLVLNAGVSDDLALAAAFSVYVCGTHNKCRLDALYFADGWNYLRDILLLVLTHHYLDVEEPLALLVAPSICMALTCLIASGDDRAGRYSLRIFAEILRRLASHLHLIIAMDNELVHLAERRCGDIVVGPRCKCGGTAVAPVVKWDQGEGKPQDRWSRTYVTREKSPTRPVRETVDDTPPSTSTGSRRFPRPASSITLGSRVSAHIANATIPRPPSPLKHSSSADSPSSSAAAAAGILPNPNGSELAKVYGSVLQPKETLDSFHCALCSTSFPPDATIYPDPSTLSSTGAALTPGNNTRFLCRPCFVDNGGSKGDCPACYRPVLILKSEGGFVENSGRVWHKKCFQCEGCGKDIGDTPMVDLLGKPCCADCFDTCLTRSNRNTPQKPGRKDEGPLSNLGGTRRGEREREGSPTLEELEQRLGIARSRENTPIKDDFPLRSNGGLKSPTLTPVRSPLASRYTPGNIGSVDSSPITERLAARVRADSFPSLGSSPAMQPGTSARSFNRFKSPEPEMPDRDSSPLSTRRFSRYRSPEPEDGPSDGSPAARRTYNRFRSPEPDVFGSSPISRATGSPRYGSPSASSKQPTEEAIEEMKKRFLGQASPAPATGSPSASKASAETMTPRRRSRSRARSSIVDESGVLRPSLTGTSAGGGRETASRLPRKSGTPSLRNSPSVGSLQSSVRQDKTGETDYTLRRDRTGDDEVESLLGEKVPTGTLIDLSPDPQDTEVDLPWSKSTGPMSDIPTVLSASRSTGSLGGRTGLGIRTATSRTDLDSAYDQSVPSTPDLAGEFSDTTSTTQSSSAPSTPPSLSPPSRRVSTYALNINKREVTPMKSQITGSTYASSTSGSGTRRPRTSDALSSNTPTPKSKTLPSGMNLPSPTPLSSDARCAKCNQPLFTKKYGGKFVTVPEEPSSTGVPPKTYHTACFRCKVCDGPFEEHEGGRAVFVRGEEGACHVEVRCLVCTTGESEGSQVLELNSKANDHRVDHDASLYLARSQHC